MKKKIFTFVGLALTSVFSTVFATYQMKMEVKDQVNEVLAECRKNDEEEA